MLKDEFIHIGDVTIKVERTGAQRDPTLDDPRDWRGLLVVPPQDPKSVSSVLAAVETTARALIMEITSSNPGEARTYTVSPDLWAKTLAILSSQGSCATI